MLKQVGQRKEITDADVRRAFARCRGRLKLAAKAPDLRHMFDKLAVLDRDLLAVVLSTHAQAPTADMLHSVIVSMAELVRLAYYKSPPDAD